MNMIFSVICITQ